MNNSNDNQGNQNVSFLDKVSSSDIFTISSDIIPSTIYVYKCYLMASLGIADILCVSFDEKHL